MYANPRDCKFTRGSKSQPKHKTNIEDLETTSYRIINYEVWFITKSIHRAHFNEPSDKIVVYFCGRSFGEIPGIVLELFGRYFWSVFPLSIQ